MSLSITFRRQARFEFDEAADWYEKQRPGLGVRFVAAIQRVLNQARENPARYAKVLDHVRVRPVQGFPYCIYYLEEPEQLVVLAVFHAARDPADWQARM